MRAARASEEATSWTIERGACAIPACYKHCSISNSTSPRGASKRGRDRDGMPHEERWLDSSSCPACCPQLLSKIMGGSAFTIIRRMRHSHLILVTI